MKYDLDVFCGFYQQPLDGEWDDQITAYHVTHRKNVASITANGLKANGCVATSDGIDRRAAVYLFAAHCDARDRNIRAALFGSETDLVVVTVSIPRSAYTNLHDDGLFNSSVICADGSYPTAMQYTDNIPAEWINNVNA